MPEGQTTQWGGVVKGVVKVLAVVAVGVGIYLGTGFGLEAAAKGLGWNEMANVGARMLGSVGSLVGYLSGATEWLGNGISDSFNWVIDQFTPDAATTAATATDVPAIDTAAFDRSTLDVALQTAAGPMQGNVDTILAARDAIAPSVIEHAHEVGGLIESINQLQLDQAVADMQTFSAEEVALRYPELVNQLPQISRDAQALAEGLSTTHAAYGTSYPVLQAELEHGIEQIRHIQTAATELTGQLNGLHGAVQAFVHPVAEGIGTGTAIAAGTGAAAAAGGAAYLAGRHTGRLAGRDDVVKAIVGEHTRRVAERQATAQNIALENGV